MEHLMTSDAIAGIVANRARIDPGFLQAGKAFDVSIRGLQSREMQEEVYLVSIYSDNPRAVVVSDYFVPYTHVSAADLDELVNIREHALEPVYRVAQTPGLGKKVVSIFGPALGFDSDRLFDRAAVIQIDVDAFEFLTNAMPNDYSRPGFGIYVFAEDGEPVFARPVAGKESADLWAEIETGVSAGEDAVVIRDRAGFILRPSERVLGLSYAFVFPMSELRDKLSSTLLQMVFLYFVVVGVFVLISISLTRPYNRRLRKLIGRITAIKRGDLRDESPIGGNDEIGLVDGHLSEMVVRLRELLRTVYEEELELKEAQLTALESQINPHFLFNTLELINSIATVHDNEEICAITENLGRMLRYNLNSASSHWATLEEEFANVRDYLSIYQFRFDGSFAVDLQVDPNALQTQVPRFILQPLVENSIKHGFADSPRGRELSMSARLEKDSLCLVIHDNGVGMDEAQQEDLNVFMREAVSNRHLHPKRGERIGLKNVFMRLLLTHGEDFSMRIDTETGKGTRVTILTPIRTARVDHVQTAHSR
jgi:sensor histidine kinase YesM